jgi:tetratricopeptide (TPR) repeat protein
MIPLVGSMPQGSGSSMATVDKRTEVFVSATSGDLRSVRQMVKDGLLTMGCHPIEQTNFPPDYRGVVEMLETRIAACDAVVHFVGIRYGTEPDPKTLPPGEPRRSYTQLEAEFARRLGKKLYVFLCPDDFPFDPEPNIEPDDKRALQRAYREEVSAHGRQLINTVRTPSDVVRQIRELQLDLEKLQGSLTVHRSRTRATFAVVAAVLAAVAAGVWWWLPSVIDESLRIDDERIRAHLVEAIERTAEQRIGELNTSGASWRDVEAVRSERTAQLAQVDRTLGSIRRAFADDEANDVYREAVGILEREGTGEVLAYLDHRSGDISASIAQQRAIAESERTALRQALRPWLLEAWMLESRFEWDASIAKYEAILQQDSEWTEATNDFAALLRRRGEVVDPIVGDAMLSRAQTLLSRSATLLADETTSLDWARTQSNLGAVLSAMADNLVATDAQTLLTQAKEAYRAALTVYTADSHPEEWATAQGNLGIVLANEATYTAAADARALLSEAADAFRATLAVFTPVASPERWSTTQHNLGNTLLNQARIANDADAAELFQQALEAYRAALTVRPRDAMPREWAFSTIGLANTLAALGGDATDTASQTLFLSRAVEEYRAALTVLTPADTPQLWATTQGNLGIALWEHGTRATGDQAGALYALAEQAYRAALTVNTREARPYDWSVTQNRLGRTLYDHGTSTTGGESESLLLQAVEAHKAALTVITPEANPRGAASTLASLHRVYHEWLFDFEAAFETARLRAQLDASGGPDLVETHFTTARFTEAIERARGLQQPAGDARRSAQVGAAMRVLEVLSLVASGRIDEADDRLARLVELVGDQGPDFRLAWTWRGTRHYIETSNEPGIAKSRRQLLALVDAADDDSAVLERLRAVDL